MSTSFVRTPSRPRTGVDVCIIGNLTVDVIMRGIDEMPHWGHEALATTRSESVGGQAGGMAFACVALGVRAAVVADVGEDDAGQRIHRELEAAGVGVDSVSVVPGGITPLTVAVVRADGERAFISDLGRLRPFDALGAAQHLPHALDAPVVALVGTSNLTGINLEKAADLLGSARRAGSLTVFDSGWDPQGWAKESVAQIRAVLAETDLFVPNLDEAGALTGRTKVAEMLEELAPLVAGVVMVKCGALGSYTVVDGDLVHVPAIPTEVDNAVGAGDVYDAGVVVGYLRGRDVLGSMALGTAAASLYVSRRHDRFPSFDEVDSLAQNVAPSVVEERP